MLERLENAQRPFSALVVTGEQRYEGRRSLLEGCDDDAHHDDHKDGDQHGSECAVHDIEEHDRRSGHAQRAGTTDAGVARDNTVSRGEDRQISAGHDVPTNLRVPISRRGARVAWSPTPQS